MVWWWTFGSVPEVPPQEFFDTRVTGTDIVIDVRTRSEYDGGHIEGAVWCSLIPPWNFEARVTETLDAIDALWRENKRRILFICLSAHRSISAVKLLTQMGRVNVVQLQGGMQAWRALNLPEVVEQAAVENNNNNNNEEEEAMQGGKVDIHNATTSTTATTATTATATTEHVPLPADSHEQ